MDYREAGVDITAAEVDEALDLVRKALKSAAPRAA